MANVFEHPAIIASEALRHLEDALVIAPLCAKDLTSNFTNTSNGWKVGDTVNFKTEGEYSVTDYTEGADVTVQDIRSSKRPMEIEHHYDVSVQVTAREQTLELDSFSDQVIRPSVYKLAETVDTYIGTKILEAQGLYTSATLFETAADIAFARKNATLQQLAPDRFCLVDLDTEATLLGQTWFNQSQTRGAAGLTTLATGNMGHVMGMDFFSSIAFPTNSSAHTAGDAICATNNTSGTTNLIGDTSLIVDTQTAGKSLNAGDRLTVAGVRRPLIVKTSIAAGAGAHDIAAEYELEYPITEIIPDDAAVTVIGSAADLTYNAAIFDSQTLGIAFPMLDLPDDAVAATASNNGISIRVVKQYNITNKTTTMSLDLLVGGFMLDTRRCTICSTSV